MKDEEGHEWGLHGWRTLQEEAFVMSTPDGKVSTVCNLGHACHMSGGQRALTLVNAGGWPQLICCGSRNEVSPCYEAIVEAVRLENPQINYLIGLSLKQAISQRNSPPLSGEVWLAAYRAALEKLLKMQSSELSALIGEAHRALVEELPRDSFATLGFYDLKQ